MDSVGWLDAELRHPDLEILIEECHRLETGANRFVVDDTMGDLMGISTLDTYEKWEDHDDDLEVLALAEFRESRKCAAQAPDPVLVAVPDRRMVFGC
jgi:hypothetical protein